jgi:signal transduction histidine kinase
MRVRLSVTARITLLSIALALASSLVLIGVVWKQTHDDALGTVRRETIEKADALLAVWRSGGVEAVRDAIDHARAPGDVSLLLAVLDARGRRVAGYVPAPLAVSLTPTNFAVADIDASGAILDAGYALHPIGPYWLLAGRSLDRVETEQRAIERALGIAVLVSLALGAVAGMVVARYVARRLVAIARVIDAAGEGDLSRRVPMITDSNDAFDRLAARLNAMLARIEGLMTELRVVTDSLAHDLRSPLARLRTKTEQAVLIADPAGREAALGGLLVETDLVMRMLTTVIEISRAEAASRDRFTLVPPAAVIAVVAELYEPVVEEAGLAFRVETDTALPPMPVHRELLSQAIANLIDNAIRHGGAGGEVRLTLARTEAGVSITVADRGPGIPAGDRAQALKRFGRLDSARSTPGAGLGMALIEAVARLHGGEFELGDNGPGLIARMVLPQRSAR